jgi:hypothetical protein
MKEQLIERLQLMDEAIKNQTQKLQQANADLNMLNGCRQELLHIIHMLDQEEKEIKVKLDENCHVVTDEVPPCENNA